MDAEFFTDFDFDGQAVGVPTGFATAVKPFHGFVTREHVFDRAGQAVTGVWFSVGGGGAFKEHILFGAFALLERSIVDVFLTPELQNALFQLWKADVVFDGLKSFAGRIRHE